MAHKYLVLETLLQVASLQEAMGRCYSAADPECAFAQGQYPIPPYSTPNDPPLPTDYTWFYLQPARPAASEWVGGPLVIRIPSYPGVLALAQSAPTHTLSNGVEYTIDLSGVVDYGDLSAEAKALFPEDAPPEE